MMWCPVDITIGGAHLHHVCERYPRDVGRHFDEKQSPSLLGHNGTAFDDNINKGYVEELQMMQQCLEGPLQEFKPAHLG
jgi:hypothetical protein